MVIQVAMRCVVGLLRVASGASVIAACVLWCGICQEFHRLHVGDVIKFGESTRLYVLEGPEELRPAEYESDNLVSCLAPA